MELKQKWGFTDPRTTEEYEDCDICANDIFRDSWQEAGVERRAFAAPAGEAGNGSPQLGEEALVQAITDRVIAELQKQ